VAIGTGALSADVAGHRTVAIGYNSLRLQTYASSTNSNNTAVGFNTGQALTSGVHNTFIGVQAGQSFTDADYNTAIGQQALVTDTQGSRSTAVGAGALTTQNFSSATNTNNTAVGYGAGTAVTTGSGNTFVGADSGDATDDGSYNVAVGDGALSANCGNSNVAIGRLAGTDCTGTDNVFVGEQAGVACVATSSNTFIGEQAGSTITSGENNTIIGGYNGNHDGLDLRTADNYIVVSDGSGEVGLFVDNNNSRVFVSNAGSFKMAVRAKNASGTETMIKFFRLAGGNDSTATSSGQIDTNSSDQAVYSTSSDYRLKENVGYDFDATTRLKQLKPARFNFKVTPDETVDGFLAHEVESVVPNAITGKKDAVDENGDIDPQGIDHGFLVPLLTKSLQEALARIETLEADVKALKGE
jgi:hypothetical protein